MSLSTKLLQVFFLISITIVLGCATTRQAGEKDLMTSETENGAEKNPLAHRFDTSRIFSGNFTGFMLYDPEQDSVLLARNADKYFTPASNTKLFTFYTGLKMLPESLPGLQYIEQGDSLIFRGTGDPSFLHPDFGNDRIYQLLKQSDNSLYYTDVHFEDKLLGPGWSWSDYQYYYSTEKSPFPMYGNVVRFTVEEIEQRHIKSDEHGLVLSPEFFQSHIEQTRGEEEAPLLFREFNQNTFKYQPQSDTITYTIDKPFHYTPELVTRMLSDTLGKPVQYINANMEETFETIYSIPADTAYKRMLQPSDNFIAEQLLLATASEKNMPLNSREVIDYMKENHLQDMPDEPQWVDGSGLSRYNMFTPRSMIWLLKQIRDEFTNDKELFALLPAGGESGTISNWYGHREGGPPYVFAKTGTLSNNHCLSGYIVARSGKTLLFSFMNNHYVTSSSVVKEEMEKILWFIYENY